MVDLQRFDQAMDIVEKAFGRLTVEELRWLWSIRQEAITDILVSAMCDAGMSPEEID